MYLLLAINCSRYTMHLIKILITATSPLCTLEKEKLWSLGKHIKNSLENYKRTIEDIKKRIPYLQWQLPMVGYRLYKTKTWIEMACSNARSTPDVISYAVRIQITWAGYQIQVCCTMSAIPTQYWQSAMPEITKCDNKWDIPYEVGEHILMISLWT